MLLTNNTNYKKLLVILPIVSLLSYIISDILFFSVLDILPSLLNIIFIILNIIAPITLLIYTTKFYDKQKKHLYDSIIYFIIATPNLLNLILNFNYYFIDNFKYAFGSVINFLGFLVNVIAIILPLAFICTGCCTLKKRLSTAIVIVPLALGVSDILINVIIRLIQVIGRYLTLSISDISNCMFYIGDLALYVCLFVYSINNVPPVNALAKASKMQPKEALTFLKNSLENNIITEEEYNAKRAEIISKL